MKLFGLDMNLKLFFNLIVLNGLIIFDMVLITIVMLFEVPSNVAWNIQIFDLTVCAILLIEWLATFYKSHPKTTFLKQRDNILGLIASIPFDVILIAITPNMVLLKYLRLLKLLRVMFLFKRFSIIIKRFLHKTNMGIILGGMLFTILIFTLLLYIFGPTYGLYDDFYFVIVTLTTVGYGDITPKTDIEKTISIVLIIIGIFIFSTITAAISSFLTERLLEDGDGDITTTINSNVDEKFETLSDRLDTIQEENRMLKEEINELKELIKKNE